MKVFVINVRPSWAVLLAGIGCSWCVTCSISVVMLPEFKISTSKKTVEDSAKCLLYQSA